MIINTAACIDHDCQIADFSHIAPGAHLAGNVSVGEGALLGIGCCAVPGASIGAWATVGAGAVSTGTVPEGSTAVGVPARVRGSVGHPRGPQDGDLATTKKT